MIGVSKKTKLAIYIPFTIIAITCLLPFFIMIANAGKEDIEIATSISLIPTGHYIDNLKVATGVAPIFQGLLNSTFVAVLTTTLSIYFSTLVAYGFSVYKFRGNRILFSIVLLTMMIPGQLSFLGFYDMIKSMGLINTYVPLIIPGIANASSVYFLKQYCDQVISIDTIESARIDGTSEIKIFHKVILPILTPAMSTMAIFTFIKSWNDYLIPLLILNDTDKYTLPVMLRYISSVSTLDTANFGNTQAAIYISALVSVIPILIVFIIFSKRIVSGLNAGSVKG